MVEFLAVFFGGGLGSVSRYGLLRLGGMFGVEAVWVVMTINLVGSLLIGLLIGAMTTRIDLHESTRVFLQIGLLGGFTTFSTFSAQFGLLAERSLWLTVL